MEGEHPNSGPVGTEREICGIEAPLAVAPGSEGLRSAEHRGKECDLKLIEVYYTTMREEMNRHIEGRDHVVVAYFVVISGVFSLAIAQSKYDFVLALVPIISYGFSVYYFYHHAIMGHIAAYLKYDLQAHIDQLSKVPQWDNSSPHDRYVPGVLQYLSIATLLLFVLPLVLSHLYLLFKYRNYLVPSATVSLEQLVAWFALAVNTILTITTIFTFVQSYLHRRKYW